MNKMAICLISVAFCVATAAGMAHAGTTDEPVVVRWEQLSDRDHMQSVDDSDARGLMLQMAAGECLLSRTQPDSPFIGRCGIFEEPPEGLKVFDGGSAHFPLKHSTLHVRIDRHTDEEGELVSVLTASKERCSLEPTGGNSYIVVCEAQWRARKVVPATAFELPTALDVATLRTELRSRPLAVRWQKARIAKFSIGPRHGYTLLQHRPTVVAGRWGSYRWRLPERYSVNKHAGLSLYRRLSQPE